jgi:hypothetical protein
MKKDWSFESELKSFTLDNHAEIANYFVAATKECVEKIIGDKFNTVMEKILKDEVLDACKNKVKKLINEKIDSKYKEMEFEIDRMIEKDLKKKIDSYFDKKKKNLNLVKKMIIFSK